VEINLNLKLKSKLNLDQHLIFRNLLSGGNATRTPLVYTGFVEYFVKTIIVLRLLTIESHIRGLHTMYTIDQAGKCPS